MSAQLVLTIVVGILSVVLITVSVLLVTTNRALRNVTEKLEKTSSERDGAVTELRRVQEDTDLFTITSCQCHGGKRKCNCKIILTWKQQAFSQGAWDVLIARRCPNFDEYASNDFYTQSKAITGLDYVLFEGHPPC